jgi:NADH:ubiquinone oxidoreductase subunit
VTRFLNRALQRVSGVVMMAWFQRIFVWWRGTTIGTHLFTMRRGERVGEDECGNIYYQTGDGKRRWVVYNGEIEASCVSADWHGWLHHTFAEPPTKMPLKRQQWEKDHQPNLTGTPEACRPKGSLLREGLRAKSGADYEAWSPQ